MGQWWKSKWSFLVYLLVLDSTATSLQLQADHPGVLVWGKATVLSVPGILMSTICKSLWTPPLPPSCVSRRSVSMGKEKQQQKKTRWQHPKENVGKKKGEWRIIIYWSVCDLWGKDSFCRMGLNDLGRTFCPFVHVDPRLQDRKPESDTLPFQKAVESILTERSWMKARQSLRASQDSRPCIYQCIFLHCKTHFLSLSWETGDTGVRGRGGRWGGRSGHKCTSVTHSCYLHTWSP